MTTTSERDGTRSLLAMIGLALIALAIILVGCKANDRARLRALSPVVVTVPGASAAVTSAVLAYVLPIATVTPELLGWTVSVEPYPVKLPFPQPNPFQPSQIITDATSYTDPGRRHISLSWHMRLDGSVDVEDLPYEIANVRCNCESGLRK